MRCPSCGAQNPDIHLYCASCGAIVVKPVAVGDSQIENARRTIYSAVQRRMTTDRVLSYLWVLIPILIFVFTLATTVFLLIWDHYYPSGEDSIVRDLIAMSTLPASILSDIILAILAYKLVKRQNEHFAREIEFREGTIGLIRSVAGSPQREALLAREMTVMNSAHHIREDWHNPILWALAVGTPTIAIVIAGVAMYLLVLTGENESFSILVLLLAAIVIAELAYLILWLYLLYFLGNNMFDHDRRWNSFIHQARTAMSKLALPGGRPYRVSRLPQRNLVLYIVLTIFTGVFMFYWWYTLIKDPNEHFKAQSEFEDHVLSVITQPLPFTASASQR